MDNILADFDVSQFKLGTLCKRNHDYKGTGKSLRYSNQKTAAPCVDCVKEKNRSEERKKSRRVPKKDPRDKLKARTIENENGCWIFQGSGLPAGYGLFMHNYGQDLAHRWAYRLWIGEIPEGLFVCHHCDTPACCNPDHLFLGTHRENMADMVAKDRQVHWDKDTYTNTVFTPEEVEHLRATLPRTQAAYEEVARKYSCNPQTVANLVRGRSWKDVPMPSR